MRFTKTLGAFTLAGALVTGGPAAAVADQSVSNQDQQFLRAAHQSNLAEIAAARIAQRRATVPVTRDLAARWLADHQRLDLAVTRVAGQLHVTLPNSPDAEQQRTADRYGRTIGGEFDRLWISSQIVGHREAEALGRAELDHGSDPRVESLARTAGPTVETHMRLLDAAARQVGLPQGQAQRPARLAP